MTKETLKETEKPKIKYAGFWDGDAETIMHFSDLRKNPLLMPWHFGPPVFYDAQMVEIEMDAEDASGLLEKITGIIRDDD